MHIECVCACFAAQLSRPSPSVMSLSLARLLSFFSHYFTPFFLFCTILPIPILRACNYSRNRDPRCSFDEFDLQRFISLT